MNETESTLALARGRGGKLLGLDSVEFGTRFENAFSTAIPDRVAVPLTTTREVTDYIVTQVVASDAPSCSYQQACYFLKGKFVPFLSTLILVVLVFLSPVSAVFSQTQTKIIEWTKSPIGSNGEAAQKDLQLFPQIDGVEIEEILVGGKSRFIGERFVADDDWLKAIIFRVKNLTDQRLVRLQITLVLPEMGAESPDIPFCFGCEEVEKAKAIKPGESVELKMVSGGFYEWLKSRMAEKGGVSRFTKAQIHHMFVTLPSGPTWFSGCIKTSDPKNACPHKAQ